MVGDERVQSLHRCAKYLDMKIQSCLQQLPVAGSKEILPAHRVSRPTGRRPVLRPKLRNDFIEGALHGRERSVQGCHMAKCEFILLDHLANCTLLQCVLQIQNERLYALRPSLNPFQLFRGISDKRHNLGDLFVALTNRTGECDDGCGQTNRIHTRRNQSTDSRLGSKQHISSLEEGCADC